MFLKRLERRKNGKGHTYWALVESIRTTRGSRHRVVAYLGELKKGRRSGWASLGRQLDRKDRPQPSLFDPAAHPGPADDVEWVRIQGVRMERTRRFGNVWLALGLWRLVGLDQLLEERMPSGREQVAWPIVAAILTIARFCEPSSELHIEDTWYRSTALDDLLGVPVEPVCTNRLYAGLDGLLVHKEAIQRHLKQRLGNLFDLKYDLLLYDVTSTYFEGQCLANELAKRGYSRDHRPDCPQVCIGLVVTEEGMPIGYEVFAGNTADATTVPMIVATMEARYGRAHRIWVMDRGMVSQENLRFLPAGTQRLVHRGNPEGVAAGVREAVDRRDLAGGAGGGRGPVGAGPGWDRDVRAGPQPGSPGQGAGDAPAVRRADGGRLAASGGGGRRRDAAVAQRRLGRLQGQNWRAAGGFDVKIASVRQAGRQTRLHITWSRNERWDRWAALSEGCYLLRTNLNETDPVVLWRRYIQLTEAEWAFRINKDELNLRPIWHQLADRVAAHILVCFLAYVLWKTLGKWMQASGLGDAPRTLVEDLAKIHSGDVVLPTRRADGQPGRTIRIRCVTRPDPAQRVLLGRLGLRMPDHLRYLEEVAQM